MYTSGNGSGATLTGLEASVRKLSGAKSTLEDLFAYGKVVLHTQHGSIERSCSGLTLAQLMLLLGLLGITSTETPSTTGGETSAGAPSARTTETATDSSGDSTPSASPEASPFTHSHMVFDPVYDFSQLRKDDLIVTTRYSEDGEIARIIQLTKDAGDLNIRVEMASTGARVWVSLADIKGVKQ